MVYGFHPLFNLGFNHGHNPGFNPKCLWIVGWRLWHTKLGNESQRVCVCVHIYIYIYIYLSIYLFNIGMYIYRFLHLSNMYIIMHIYIYVYMGSLKKIRAETSELQAQCSIDRCAGYRATNTTNKL